MGIKQNLSTPLSWEELSQFVSDDSDRIQGPTNSYALLRLFGQPIENLRVTFYRDHHAWCPYCQKVWLWLEWKRIPYKVRKVTMRCYGNKESWYTKKVPSGMLPALEIDNRLYTESDQILLELEDTFGPLGTPLTAPRSLELRSLERKLFQAWCVWLCNSAFIQRQENQRKEHFQEVAREMERQLIVNQEPWLDPVFHSSGKSFPGSSDVVFIPYLERMNASLAYYKGLNLREEHPKIGTWFKSLEALEVYRGTQGDMHTHAHDLPPQMGGCWVNSNTKQKQFSLAIDSGEGLGEFEMSFSTEQESNSQNPESVALSRVLKHRQNLIALNPLGSNLFDQPLRAALTLMIKGEPCLPQEGSAQGLRYLKDRISVPRDMPLLSARKFRKALEKTAQLDSSQQGPAIDTKNRFDQNPMPFIKDSPKSFDQ
ncbi:glutathione S-transferase [Prochlorococcus sp. MIT 1307]|uniref:glutathione S-transferase family protein n=1 Tax=Prochlorococcus sp. MIT 1307 TaxID=3096219 RepID=UPI002A754C74|nr:glutathione S-transferase [Prochlorococcus sp. MIT 1307]